MARIEDEDRRRLRARSGARFPREVEDASVLTTWAHMAVSGKKKKRGKEGAAVCGASRALAGLAGSRGLVGLAQLGWLGWEAAAFLFFFD